LQFEHGRLRAEASRLEQQLAKHQQEAESVGQAKVVSLDEESPRLFFETVVAPKEGPEPAPIGRVSPETPTPGIMNGWAPEEVESISSAAEGEPLLASLGLSARGRKKGEPVSIKDLCVRVAELHRTNLDLEQKLKARLATIDGIEEDMRGLDEESGLRVRLEPVGPAPDMSDWKGFAKHHAQLTVQKVQRHQHVQRLEQQFRIVTRKLLQRPLWLWLFYMQLLFVWFAELWHLLFGPESRCA